MKFKVKDPVFEATETTLYQTYVASTPLCTVTYTRGSDGRCWWMVSKDQRPCHRRGEYEPDLATARERCLEAYREEMAKLAQPILECLEIEQ